MKDLGHPKYWNDDALREKPNDCPKGYKVSAKEWNRPIKELIELPTEELKELAMQRHPKASRGKGKYTKTALNAQKIIFERAGSPFMSSTHWKNDYRVVAKL